MKKKIIITVLLIAVLSVCLSAQQQTSGSGSFPEDRAQNRIAVSAGLIGLFDVSYERLLTPNFSILGQISYNNLVIADSFSVSGKGRWYPFSGAFFLDLGLGYSHGYNITDQISKIIADMLLMMFSFGLWGLSEDYQNRDYGANAYEHGFYVQPGLGWNIDIGEQDKFLLPISMGLDIRIAQNTTVLPFIRIGLGYAF